MILARGLRPSSSALDALMRMRAEAPSFNGEAFAAVTVPLPSVLNTGLKLGTLSNITFLYSSSSVILVSFPFLSLITTGTISFSKAPVSYARAALLYDSIACPSWISRVIPCFLAAFSAQLPIWKSLYTSQSPSVNNPSLAVKFPNAGFVLGR